MLLGGKFSEAKNRADWDIDKTDITLKLFNLIPKVIILPTFRVYTMSEINTLVASRGHPFGLRAREADKLYEFPFHDLMHAEAIAFRDFGLDPTNYRVFLKLVNHTISTSENIFSSFRNWRKSLPEEERSLAEFQWQWQTQESATGIVDTTTFRDISLLTVEADSAYYRAYREGVEEEGGVPLAFEVFRSKNKIVRSKLIGFVDSYILTTNTQR